MPPRSRSEGRGSGATSTSPPRRHPRVSGVRAWMAGILATVLATVILAWLSALGVMPGSTPSAGRPADASDPKAGGAPFSVAADFTADKCGGWVVPDILKPSDYPTAQDWTPWVE